MTKVEEELTKLSGQWELMMRAIRSAGGALAKKPALVNQAKSMGTTTYTHPYWEQRNKEAAIADIIPRARKMFSGAAETLGGHNVDRVLQQQHQKAMKNPFIRTQAKYRPKSMTEEEIAGTTSDFMSDVLRGKKEVPWLEDLPALSKGRVKLVRTLEQGRKAVKGEQKTTRKARGLLAGGVALPVAGTSLLAKEGADGPALKKPSIKKPDLKDTAQTVLPAAAAGVAGTTPIVQGLRSGALGKWSPGGKEFKDVGALRKSLKPGDVVLTSSPGKGGAFKPIISALGGDPFGYHVESVQDVPKGGAGRSVGFIHSSPGLGGAYGYEGPLAEGEDVIVRRFKDEATRKQYLKNLSKREMAEEMLEDVFGADARSTMYDKSQSVRAAGKSFLPSPLQKLLDRGKPSTGATVCSSLPGMASPVCITPGVKGKDVLPHHIRRSKAFETVGSYRAPRNMSQRVFERILQTSPWLLRTGIGAGLGYGAYRGAKALLGSSDKSKP
jgi:hypothetical protein